MPYFQGRSVKSDGLGHDNHVARHTASEKDLPSQKTNMKMEKQHFADVFSY